MDIEKCLKNYDFFRRRRRLEYRHIRDMSNPFEMTDEMFIKLFRLNKEAVNNLIEELAEFVNEPQRINKVPFFLQVSVQSFVYIFCMLSTIF